MPKCVILEGVNGQSLRLEKRLETLGVNCDITHDTQEAIDLCVESVPDAIIFDGDMGDVDPAAFAKEVRQVEGGKSIALIMCSKHEASDTAEEALESGVHACIHKPIDPDQLAEQLHDLGVL